MCVCMYVCMHVCVYVCMMRIKSIGICMCGGVCKQFTDM